jgi:serine/threonine protein kinase
VWLAQHGELGRPRAVKALRPGAFAAEALTALRQEARVMAALKPHPNRVVVHDLVEQPDGPLVVMGYVDGGSLGKQAPLPWERAVRYVADAAEGLAEVHAANIYHGDIKPGNLLWDRDRDTAVLCDFGLAVHAWRPRRGGGTLGYTAPELLDGGSPSERSDVFALAATLYALLVGRPSFSTTDPVASLVEAHGGLRSPVRELAAFPHGVEGAILYGLEPDPSRRPGLAAFLRRLRQVHLEELAEELRRLAGRSTCRTRLEVVVSAADPAAKVFRRVLACSSRDDAPEACVRPGELVRLEVCADADGHLTILNFSETGDLDLLFPSSPEQGGTITAGRPQRLTVRLTPPGPDRTAVVWTQTPSRLTVSQWRERIASGQIVPPERRMEAVLHEAELAPDDWTAILLTVAQHGT